MFPNVMDLPRLLALSTLLVLALVYDVVSRRIPNRLVLTGIWVGWGLALMPGGIGWASSLTGGMVGFLVFGVLYALRMMGAGDVKLATAIGLFMGSQAMPGVCLSMLLAGGLLSLAWALARSSTQSLPSWMLPVWQQLQDFKKHEPTHSPRTAAASVPYAMAMALGSWLYLAWLWGSR